MNKDADNLYYVSGVIESCSEPSVHIGIMLGFIAKYGTNSIFTEKVERTHYSFLMPPPTLEQREIIVGNSDKYHDVIFEVDSDKISLVLQGYDLLKKTLGRIRGEAELIDFNKEVFKKNMDGQRHVEVRIDNFFYREINAIDEKIKSIKRDIALGIEE